MCRIGCTLLFLCDVPDALYYFYVPYRVYFIILCDVPDTFGDYESQSCAVIGVSRYFWCFFFSHATWSVHRDAFLLAFLSSFLPPLKFPIIMCTGSDKFHFPSSPPSPLLPLSSLLCTIPRRLGCNECSTCYGSVFMLHLAKRKPILPLRFLTLMLYLFHPSSSPFNSSFSFWFPFWNKYLLIWPTAFKCLFLGVLFYYYFFSLRSDTVCFFFPRKISTFPSFFSSFLYFPYSVWTEFLDNVHLGLYFTTDHCFSNVWTNIYKSKSFCGKMKI